MHQPLGGLYLSGSQKAGLNKQVASLEIEKEQYMLEHESVALKRNIESSSGYIREVKFIIPSYH
jgi:hypothetical protein